MKEGWPLLLGNFASLFGCLEAAWLIFLFVFARNSFLVY